MTTEKPKILIVDDEKIYLDVLVELLKGEYRTVIAKTGEQALKRAVAEVPPELILLDVLMPNMDGYEVCRQLKANPKTRTIPVIFLTVKGEIEDEVRGFEIGASDYIAKPLSPPILKARIQTHLALSNQRLALGQLVEERTWELVRLKDEALAAKETAQRADKAKTRFLAGISHEFRTPLNAVIGYAQVMAVDPDFDPKKQAWATEIINAGYRLLELVNDVMDLASLEEGRLQMVTKQTDLAQVLGECQVLATALATAFKVALFFALKDHQVATPKWVQADASRLKQSLLILISNACKYNREGGSVRIDCAGRGDYIRLRVTDTGPGIAPELQSRLFLPFDRLAVEGGSIHGTGVGLTIAKQLIEMMGGNIGVESVLGEGSCFWVELRCVS